MKHMSNNNVVYIGSNPPMSYVLAVITAYNASPEGITLKARGRAISNAVDVAEVCRNKFLTGVGRPIVEIGTEELDGENGKRNVSAVAIHLRPENGQPAEISKPKIEKSKEKTSLKHDITEISGVGAVTAEKLKAAGYEYAEQVAKEKPESLAGKAGFTENQASKLIEAAKGL